jgi:acetoin utilization deacetylase AcuC-like enzyme
VHQGNGTASILADDPDSFTFSMHGSKNFPLRKMASGLDVPLADGTGDEEYLAKLADGLASVQRQPHFDLAIYLAGADPFSGDRLGRMNLSKAGLALRDTMVMDWCKKQQIPLAIAMSGGYATNVNDIVDIHAETIRLASQRQRNHQ